MAEIIDDILSSLHHHHLEPLSNQENTTKEEEEDEEGRDRVKLQWAAIERKKTFKRSRYSLLSFRSHDTETWSMREVDVAKIGGEERQLLIKKLIKNVEEDNHRLRIIPVLRSSSLSTSDKTSQPLQVASYSSNSKKNMSEL